MSQLRIPEPGLLLLSVLAAEWDAWPDLLVRIEARFGPACFLSEALAFENTSYYDAELGRPIVRRLLAFGTLAPLDCLAAAKLWTMEQEREFARPDGRRRFNLDPGLLTQERLVLATAKNFTHRVYLGQGVWADLTLVYTGGDWLILPWTFPDYAARDMLELLTALREEYRRRLFAARGPNPEPAAPPQERKVPCPRA